YGHLTFISSTITSWVPNNSSYYSFKGLNRLPCLMRRWCRSAIQRFTRLIQGPETTLFNSSAGSFSMAVASRDSSMKVPCAPPRIKGHRDRKKWKESSWIEKF
ncbi:hypothetical protein CUMW_277050, partial [Citrus unshiu]